MENALALLERLANAAKDAVSGNIDYSSGVGRELLFQELVSTCTITENDAQALRKLSKADTPLWRQTAESGVSLSMVALALQAHMTAAGSLAARLTAASVYCALLAAPGCPAASIWDEVGFQSLTRALRHASGVALSAIAAAKDANDDDDMDGGDAAGAAEEDVSVIATRLLPSLLADLRAAAAGALALKTAPETLKMLIEALVTVAAATDAPSVYSASYAVLGSLGDPRHGDPRSTYSAVFHTLSNTAILDPPTPRQGPGAKRGAKARALETVRRAALDFASQTAASSPRARDAVAALLRHICLKGCSRADLRAVAMSSTSALLPRLPAADQHRFVGFLARLARTASPQQRLLAVELASELILNFEGAFVDPVADAGPGAVQAAAAAVEEASLPPPSLGAGASGNGPPPSPFGTNVKRALSTPTEAGSTGDRWKTPSPATGPQPGVSVGLLCLSVLVQRCSDKGAQVRAKALTMLTLVVHEMTTSIDADLSVTTLAGLDRMQEDNPSDYSSAPLPAAKSGGSVSAPAVPLPTPERSARALSSLVRMARRRAADDKGVVRKSGVMLLEGLLQLCRTLSGKAPQGTTLGPSEEDLDALCACTSDVLVTVRRAGLAAVSALLRAFPSHPGLPSALVRCLGALARDTEASVQDQVCATLTDCLLEPITSRRPQEDATHAAQGVLSALADAGPAATAFLRVVLPAVRAKKLVSIKLVCTCAQAMIGLRAAPEGARIGAWVLMAEAAELEPQGCAPDFLRSEWDDLLASAGENLAIGAAAKPANPGAGTPLGEAFWARASGPLLRTIAAAATTFPKAEATRIAETIFLALRSLSLPAPSVAAYVAAMSRLCSADGDARAAGLAAATWTRSVLDDCEGALSSYVAHIRKSGGGTGFGQADPAGGDATFSFLLNPGPGGAAAANAEQKVDAPLDPRASRAAAALFTAGEVALLGAAAPSSRLQVLSQALTVNRLAADGPAGASAPVPTAVQAFAWAAVGKYALADESLAKRLVPLLVQELSRSSSPAVRNNLLVVLADLCVRYTALVDAHVNRLAGCARDPCDIVRKQALALLARLLSADYVKCRGPLFHQLLLATVDRCPSVAAVSDFILRDTLAVRLPLLAYNHFLEALFIHNRCQPNGAQAQARGATQDGSAELASQPTSLTAFEAGGGDYPVAGSGADRRAARRSIYAALLAAMTPEHRLATAGKICGEILARVADGSFPIASGSPGDEVFLDSLWVLACPEMKAAPQASSRAAEEEVGDAAAGQAGPAAALEAVADRVKGRLVAELAKKHLQDGLVPVLSVLRARLTELRHPRLRDVMAAFASLVRDHKGDLTDLIPNDRQLVKELQYELRGAAGPAGKAAAGEGAGPAGRDAAAVAAVAVAGGRGLRIAVPGGGAGAGAEASPGAPGSGRVRLSGVTPRDTPLAARVLEEAVAAAAAAGAPRDKENDGGFGGKTAARSTRAGRAARRGGAAPVDVGAATGAGVVVATVGRSKPQFQEPQAQQAVVTPKVLFSAGGTTKKKKRSKALAEGRVN